MAQHIREHLPPSATGIGCFRWDKCGFDHERGLCQWRGPGARLPRWTSAGLVLRLARPCPLDPDVPLPALPKPDVHRLIVWSAAQSGSRAHSAAVGATGLGPAGTARSAARPAARRRSPKRGPHPIATRTDHARRSPWAAGRPAAWLGLTRPSLTRRGGRPRRGSCARRPAERGPRASTSGRSALRRVVGRGPAAAGRAARRWPRACSGRSVAGCVGAGRRSAREAPRPASARRTPTRRRPARAAPRLRERKGHRFGVRGTGPGPGDGRAPAVRARPAPSVGRPDRSASRAAVR